MRWVLRILGGLVVVLVLAVGTVYTISEQAINKRYPFQEYPVSLPSDSASLAHGARIARMRCAGCHGDSLQGRADFFDEPMIARIATPNVPARLASQTDAEFAGFLRSGVRRDGISPFVMPPPGLYHISDVELGALIAYLRTLPVSANETPPNAYRLLGRMGVMLGQFKTAVAAFDTTQERVGRDSAWATTRHGEYLARVVCSECHGANLTGDPAAGAETASPSLAGALGYSPDQFVRLMREGVPREATTQLSMMAEAARYSFTHFTDDEITAIYGYLKALPSTGVSTGR
jgi:mono/diheme cytochrome c family protein